MEENDLYRNSYGEHQWHHPMPNNWHNNNFSYENWGYTNRNLNHWNSYNWSYNNWNPYYYRNSGLNDYGQQPFVVDMEEVTKKNKNFRTALWTGKHLQLTLMSINVGESIGLESHPNLDQFIRIEQGQGLVQMGDQKDRLDFQQNAYEDYAIFIPAGKWHNLTNTGNKPIKLYSIYAPPEHPFGTVHETKAIAMAAENHNQ
ncbi:cupin domain-containing protein [Bacillus mesophilus]|uniref:Cupin domain-containing protein n=1 Tax=Bacillus mesophilus TaxID=1808955 RepID=A0A6M0QBR6_9BACI|nr:cupin domain-containing protein [Bacillus mesophilus]